MHYWQTSTKAISVNLLELLSSFTSIKRFHAIQAIELNIIHISLNVSGSSITALAGIPTVDYDPPIFIFFTSTTTVLSIFILFCFVHLSIFQNLRYSAMQLLLLVLKVACLLLIFKLSISWHFLDIFWLFMN